MSVTIPKTLRNLRHFLTVDEFDAATFRALIQFAVEHKRAFQAGKTKPSLAGKVLTLIFQKPSLRTHLSFAVAMYQLGGHPVVLEDHQVGMGKREAPQDVARVTSSMCDGIMARVHSHDFIEALARYATVPVINGLSDFDHPCQAGADLVTLIEHFGDITGKKMVFVGDGFNVARSLAMSAAKFGMSFVHAAPQGYELDAEFLDRVRQADPGAELRVEHDAHAAVAGADVVVTDTWTSMGQEAERQQRQQCFAPYQVDAALMKRAKPDAVVLHCLPAYRNVEITDEVIDGPQSLAFPEAENRLHFQRALLDVLLSSK